MQKLIPALLLAFMAFTSCTKSDDVAEKSPLWVVSSYLAQDPGTITQVDKTNLFAGYTFEFNDDNTLLIHNPDGSIADAKWAVDASISATVVFGMENPYAPMEDILGAWPVNEQTDTDFKLERTVAVSTVSQPPAKLEFQKQ